MWVSYKKLTLPFLGNHCRNLNSDICTISFLLRSLCVFITVYHSIFIFLNGPQGGLDYRMSCEWVKNKLWTSCELPNINTWHWRKPRPTFRSILLKIWWTIRLFNLLPPLASKNGWVNLNWQSKRNSWNKNFGKKRCSRPWEEVIISNRILSYCEK